MKNLGTMVGTPALRLTGIEVLRGRTMTLAVPELTLDPGEVIALVGPNGAGKSTLLQVSALLLPPDQGEVWIGGERATRKTAAALRRRLAMVFQAPLLFDVTVIENAASGLRFRGLDRRETEDRATTWLDRFGVAHLANRGARSISGGESQRVALARAFAVEPTLLLLDEPFAALDAPTRAALLPDLAAGLRTTGTAAMVVTHDPAEAFHLADRLGVMLGGRIIQLDQPELIRAKPASSDVAAYVGGLDALIPRR